MSPAIAFAEARQTSLDQENSEASEQQYKAAKDYFLRLEHDNVLGQDRANWLYGARNFRKIYLEQNTGSLGASSLFMTATMYRRMYDRFNVPIDLDNAITQYIQVATLYPGNTFADDALFNAAESLLLGTGKEQQATDLYRKIIDIYPKSDHYEKALSRVREHNKKPQELVAEVSSNELRPKNLAQIFPIKYWSSANYTRIVIPTSSPVSFTASLLEKKENQPRKLSIELTKSSIPSLNPPVIIQEGLLRQIRTDQLNSDTARILLDLDAFSEYKIFSLTEPFRVIVDIQSGTQLSALEAPENRPHLALQPAGATKSEEPLLKSMSAQIVINLEDHKKRDPHDHPYKKTNHDDLISLAQQLGLGVRKIVIDPGHGGKDPGAMAFGLKEKDIVLNVSKKIARILKGTNRYEVVLTRTKDVYIPLEERTAFANTHHSDLFVSIHVNAHSDKSNGGIETYFLNLATNADAMRVAALENSTSTHNINELQNILANLMKNSKIDESSRLAQYVQTNLISGLEQKYKSRDLGVKQAPFYVLIGAEMPAVLAEISFITNPEEANLLKNEHYLDKIAEQIAAGIAAYVDHHHTAVVKF